MADFYADDVVELQRDDRVVVKSEGGRLPFRADEDGGAKGQQWAPSRSNKRFPEHLHFPASAIRRLRSPTVSSMSTMSSISSAQIPDSATTCSHSTLASPISSNYASEVIAQFAAHTIQDGKPRKIVHRTRGSTTTCSTFVDSEAGSSAWKKELDDVYGKDIERKIREVEDAEARSPTASEATIDDKPARQRPVTMIHLPSSPGWETSSTTSDDHSHEDAEAVLDYTLQLVYGFDAEESPGTLSRSRVQLQQLTHQFLSRVSNIIHTEADAQEAAYDQQEAQDAETGGHRSSSGSSSPPEQHTPNGNDARKGEKRKSPSQGNDDGFSEGEGFGGQGLMKRMKPTPKDDENLRLSCPYRKRNPNRFNVRDHHSCAMTYFPKFAELRQHIVKQHKRDDPTAFVCDRCNVDFPSRKGLRDHQRLPREEMCEISEHNPESGIDGPTSNKLLSRKRASGASPTVQWREIWNILFPDDDDAAIKPYDYTPVIEHFEISDHFERSFQFLQSSLREMMENPATLETLAAKFHQCFIESVGQCILNAQNMPYTNRSNKRTETNRLSRMSAISGSGARNSTVGKASSRPDSGVVMDDGSEESGSVLGSGGGGGAVRHNSVRTVKGWGGGIRDSILPREILPSQTPQRQRQQPRQQQQAVQYPNTMWDDAMLAQFANGDAAMGSYMDVQSWTNAVIPGQQVQHQHQQLAPAPELVEGGGGGNTMMFDESAFYNALGPVEGGFPGFFGEEHMGNKF